MKFHIVFLFLVLNLLNADTNISEERIKEKLIIGYTGSPLSIDYWKKLKSSLSLRAKELDVVVIDFTSSVFTLEEQKKALQKAIKLNVDGMIIGSDNDKITEEIDQFKKNNIPVIAVALAIKHDWISTNITTSNQNAVKLAGNFIKRKIRNKKLKDKKIIILCGDKNHENARIRASVMSGILKQEGYNIEKFYSPGWSAKYSLKDAISEYSKNDKAIIASFSCYAGASIASVHAAESYKLRPLQVGFDMDINMKEMIRNGRMDATVVQDPKTIGKIAIENMLKVLKQKNSLPKHIDIPAKLITKDNIENF